MKKVTICLTTHCIKTEKQSRFYGLSSSASHSMPSTKMIETVIKSIFEFSDLTKENTAIHIGFDKRSGREQDELYEKNLMDLLKNYEGLLYVNENEIDDPLKTAPVNFINLIKTVETEVYLLWEHDWILTRPIEIIPIVEEIETNSNVNWVRLNAKKNNNNEWEHILPYQSPDSKIPLLPTHRYTNNPHLCRTKTFNDWWSKLVYITGDNTAEPWGVPGFVEGPLALFYEFLASKVGWEEAVRMWGCYIYGNIDDEPYVRHLENSER